jgi:hypothetical protein
MSRSATTTMNNTARFGLSANYLELSGHHICGKNSSDQIPDAPELRVEKRWYALTIAPSAAVKPASQSEVLPALHRDRIRPSSST